MKQNRLIKTLAAGAAFAVAASAAVAQDSSTTTTVGAGTSGIGASTTTTVAPGTTVGGTTEVSSGLGASTSTTSTTTTNSPGVITAFTPGTDYMTFRTETAKEPVKYYYTKSTTVVDPSGATLAIDKLRPDMPATVYYAKQGDRMVVSKVVLTKPVSTYEKKESTTTTTTTTKP